MIKIYLTKRTNNLILKKYNYIITDINNIFYELFVSYDINIINETLSLINIHFDELSKKSALNIYSNYENNFINELARKIGMNNPHIKTWVNLNLSENHKDKLSKRLSFYLYLN